MNPIPVHSPAGKILVIDDNPIIQRTMYFALRDKGYSVVMCGDLSQALVLVRQERLDAILLDINFPPSGGGNHLSDGLWALDWLKRRDEVKDTPVLVISSDAPEKSKDRALAAGAAAYFHKPIDKQELTNTLAALLSGPPAAITA